MVKNFWEELIELQEADINHKKYKEELQKWKEETLKNITKWSLHPLGCCYDAKKLSTKTFDNLTDCYFSGDPEAGIANPTKEYCEVQNAMVEEIEANPQDWKLGKEGKLMIVKHKSGRKHYEKGFTWGIINDEWYRIEIALINQVGTKEHLIAEINDLEEENEEVKIRKNLSDYEEKLKEYQQRLEQVKDTVSKINNQNLEKNNSNNKDSGNSGIGVLVGSVTIIVLIVGTIVYSVLKVKVKRKLKSK